MRTLALLLILSSAAYAEGGKNGVPPTSVSGAEAKAGAVSVSGSNSTSSASADGTTAIAEGGGGGNAVTGDSNAESTSNSGVGDVSVSTKNRRQAPSVFAPAALPTAPCVVASSGGLSVPGGGLSFGRGRIDEECTLRETARMFDAFGETAFALALLCSSEAVKESGLECPSRPREDCSAADEKLRRCEAVRK